MAAGDELRHRDAVCAPLGEETQTRLRAALGGRFRAVWARGSAMPLETAVDEAAVWAMERGMMV